MLRVVDLSKPADERDAGVPSPPGVIVAQGSPPDEFWLETATFTLTDEPCGDRRVVTVASVPEALADVTRRCRRWPQASAMCDDVLRALDPAGATLAGVLTESLAYSTLQAGPEFARWLDDRGPAAVPAQPTRCSWSATRTPCVSGSTGRTDTMLFPPMCAPRYWRR
ncbi:putative enoyl-CoA hydratase [Mycobacterium kansasii 824]|nr:putative enoyl-CoA hydratase [Mycobacterium kansasii 824]